MTSWRRRIVIFPRFSRIAAVTYLTAFYMSRLFVVAFLGAASIGSRQPRPRIAQRDDSSADTSRDSGLYCRIPIYRLAFHQSA